MAADSSSSGFLSPSATPAPLEDDALVNFLQEWIVGITGVAGTNVRPRWQPEPPNIPAENVTWMAFGIIKRVADTFAAELHVTTGNGYNQIRRHEVIHVLASVYGPSANNVAGLLREGMQVAQNREILSLNNMGLVESGDVLQVPELLKEKWLYRVDLEFSIRRQIVRDYAVLNLQSGQATLNNEHYVEPITI